MRYWVWSIKNNILLIVQFQNSHKCFLWNFNISNLTHTFFTFFLFFLTVLNVSREISSSITFCCNVFSLFNALMIFTCNYFRANSGLNRDIKLSVLGLIPSVFHTFFYQYKTHWIRKLKTESASTGWAFNNTSKRTNFDLAHSYQLNLKDAYPLETVFNRS